MDLQALRYFRIVAREGSFSQAAQKLNYAQSNLSTKIRQLEGELETPLFRRHAHGVTLTEKGESLLAYADRLVHLLEEAESVVRDDGTAKGSLSVGSMESAAITFIPVLLAEYHSLCPGVSLTVKTGVSQASMRSVLDGTLDGAMSPEMAEQAMSLLKNGTYKKLDCGHVTNLEAPEEFIEILQTFFLGEK